MSVPAGGLTTIIGPNGAGKSTLLKAIMGYIIPTDGSVHCEGEDITRLRPHERVNKGVAFVPQLANVFPSLTTEENLIMGGYT
ncbi:ATP-binding cassette domain-containing protein, partial [Agreia sp. PsM10]|uniref:ATP-binding cassette domain-containing protein n=1 Tax=Agreia sp. PsM10 TaxID=3030533 RepID=UPI00263AD268